MFAHDVAAFYASGVKRLSLRGVDVAWAENLPAFCRHAVEIENFGDVLLDGVRASPAPNAEMRDAAIVLRSGDCAVLRSNETCAEPERWLDANDVRELRDEAPRFIHIAKKDTSAIR